MLNEAETTNIIQLMDDLEIDLRNGNVPAAKLLIVSIVNCLLLKFPLEWKMLGELFIGNLETYETRVALLHLLSLLKDMLWPVESGTEAGS